MQIAKSVGGQIVSADSQQVYRGMNIGTGKVSLEERMGVIHHLIDVVEPEEEMTAAKYADLARPIVDRAATPVVIAGGTMLYIRALLYGVADGPPADESLRKKLEVWANDNGLPALHKKLQVVDPKAAQKIHATDLRRMVRALEVFELTGQRLSELQKRHDFSKLTPRWPYRQIALAPNREVLYPKINQRVNDMMSDGLLDEVKGLASRGLSPADHRSQRAIGYNEIHQHLSGELELETAVSLIKRNSRRYARRQVSWYRADSRTEWFETAVDIDVEAVSNYLTGKSDETSFGSNGSRDSRF